MNIIYRICAINLLMFFGALQVMAGLDLSPEQIANREKVIQACEEHYQKARASRISIEDFSKPGIFSSSLKKQLYKDKEYSLMAFDLMMGELVEAVNNKVQLRLAPSLHKLQDLIREYSSNCSRFADGIVDFAKYASSGKASSTTAQRTFQAMIDDAKNF